MKIQQLIELLILEELEKINHEYKIGPDSLISAGTVKLYHVSNVGDITEFNPEIAASKKKSYTKREYESWDQPRIFFFTEKGQTDPGIGRIQGDNIYVVELDRSELYDLNHDEPNYFADWKTAKERYNEITGRAPYLPVNKFDLIKTLLEKDAPQVKGFLYKHGNKTIAAIYKPVKPSETITSDEFYKNEDSTQEV